MLRPLLTTRIQALRQQRIDRQRLRVRRDVLRRDGRRCEVQAADGTRRWLLDFCSNDYLGLSSHYSVSGALQDEAARSGAGGVASHLVCGHHAVHTALERAVADWLQAPAALLLGSGYLANLAVVQALLGADDVCVQDRLNHASLIDAARLAGCQLRRYPHADPEGALRQLRAAPEGAALLVSDGVFSMDGDIAPLRALALVARAQRATLYVDEAHAIGVLGEAGRGSVAAAGLDHTAVPLRLVTLGKALGSYGALVVGDADLVQHLAETARPYLYTTALPPALASAALAAVQRARQDEWRRERLVSLVAQFRAGAQHHGLPVLDSTTPIQLVPCGEDARALMLAQALEAQGFWVAAIRPPTVPEGRARLRITLSAAHTPADVARLLDALARAYATCGHAPIPHTDT